MKRRSEQNPALQRPRNSPEMMRDAIDESKLEIEKMKMQQLDMDFHIMGLRHQAETINNSTKKMMVSWGKAWGILQAKRGREEIENQDCDDHDEMAVAKRNRSAEISEMVEEMTLIPLSELIQPINVAKMKSELGSSYLDFCKKVMLEDDHQVCEVKP